MRPLILFVIAAVMVPAASAQNVSNYGTIPEPFLFLLREPAVHEELKLTEEQQSRLRQLNERFDGQLLSTRNKRPEDGQRIVTAVMSATRSGVAELLTPEQQRRLQQIRYRLRGISFVLDPVASQGLELTADQQESVREAVSARLEEVNSLQQQVNKGETTEPKARSAATRALRAEQRQIQAILTQEQRQQLPSLIGAQFDASRLGKVSFKAPELSQTGIWLNTNAMQLEQLRGKVVALHFYAFQ